MRVHRGNCDGSILLEIMISLSIAIIVLNVFIIISSVSVKSYKSMDKEDSQFFETDYLLSYLENEINKADKVYLYSNEYKYLFYRELDSGAEKHLYYTYLLKKDRVIRLATKYNRELTSGEIRRLRLFGENRLSEEVDSFEIELRPGYMDVNLSINENSVVKEFNKKIFFKCEIVD